MSHGSPRHMRMSNVFEPIELLRAIDPKPVNQYKKLGELGAISTLTVLLFTTSHTTQHESSIINVSSGREKAQKEKARKMQNR